MNNRPVRPCFSTRGVDPKCGKALSRRVQTHVARGVLRCVTLFAALLAGLRCKADKPATGRLHPGQRVADALQSCLKKFGILPLCNP